jgi:hypothetical protein
MDIVIPLGLGSIWNNNELRYCLRSVEKHLSGFDNIYIVGERPGWLKNVIHIPIEDVGPSGPARIMRKIMAACNEPNLSREFLFLNDDFFFIGNTDVNFSWYYDYPLHTMLSVLRNKGAYREAVLNTICMLEISDKPVKHFDIHLPCIYDKKEFKRIMNQYVWECPNGYIIKSLYANYLEIEGLKYFDCKINHPCKSIEEINQLVQGRPMFSIGDDIINPVFHSYLEENYPVKSNFEI